MDKKRVRACNWDEAEKRLLKQLVLERIQVIENKDVTTNTNISKKKAWQEVLSRFNILNSRSRDLKELITQWRNTKGKVKTRESEYKRAKLMTGGGPPPPSPPAEDVAIIQAIPNEFVVDSNPFDSDSLHTNIVNQPPPSAPWTPSASSSSQVDIINPPPSDPCTPSASSSNQVDIIDIFEDKEPKELKENLIATPVTTPLIQKNNIMKGRRPQHKKNSSNKDYEEELFLIMKRAKERENERAEEMHKKRMAILDVEYEYWKKKSNNIQ